MYKPLWTEVEEFYIFSDRNKKNTQLNNQQNGVNLFIK